MGKFEASTSDNDQQSTKQNSSVFEHLLEFSTEKGNFEIYVERFEASADTNKTEKDTKQRVFLTLIGDAAHIKLCNSLFLKTPAEAGYDDVMTILLKPFTPKRSVVVEQYMFY